MLWLNEVSHNFRGDSYYYDGDYHHHGRAQNVLVFTPESDSPVAVKLKPVDDNSIDYYLPVTKEFPASSVMIFCFHTQTFVTHSDMVLVPDTQHGTVEIVTRYDSLDNILED